jgi:hypothetical protein
MGTFLPPLASPQEIDYRDEDKKRSGESTCGQQYDVDVHIVVGAAMRM